MREVFTGDPSDHVLLTGGAGFIGSHLLDRFVSANRRVTILDNLSSGSMENIQHWMDRKQVRYVYGDCTQASDVQDAIHNVDVILHIVSMSDLAQSPRPHQRGLPPMSETVRVRESPHVYRVRRRVVIRFPGWDSPSRLLHCRGRRHLLGHWCRR